MPSLADEALDAVGVGGWEFDIRTKRLSCTAAALRLHEIAAADLPYPSRALRFYPPEDRRAIGAAVAAAIRSGAAWDLELTLITGAGRKVRVRSRGRAIRAAGRTVRLIGLLEAVTAPQGPPHSASSLSILARQSLNAVAVLDSDGRIAWVNDSFTRLTGYTSDQMHGQRANELLNGPETDTTTLEQMRQGIRAGTGYQVEIVQYGRDARRLELQLQCMPLRDGAGTVSGFVTVARDITQERAAEQRARREAAERARAEALLRDVIDAVPDPIVAFDADERLVLWNRAATVMFAPPVVSRLQHGVSLHDSFAMAAQAGLAEDRGATAEERRDWVARRVAAYQSQGTAVDVRFSDGRHMLLRTRRSIGGNMVGVYTDTTAVQQARELLLDILDAVPTAISAYGTDERLLLANSAHHEMMPEISAVMTPGRPLQEVLRFAAEHGLVADAGPTAQDRAAWVARRLAQHRAPGGSQPRITALPNGHFALARGRTSNNGNRVLVRTDVTELKQTEALLRQQAERDTLTGLANRAPFLAALNHALQQSVTDAGSGGALLLIDIDYLKQTNDTFGHDVGDALLSEIGRRLLRLVRGGELSARLGGDEFAVLLRGPADPTEWTQRLATVFATLGSRAELSGRQMLPSISLGGTHFPADGDDATVLLKNADMALYEAKRNGRGRSSMFRPDMTAAFARRTRIAEALRAALQIGAIEVALQPQRRLRGGHAGFEALARWHDGKEWIPPDEFIPVAEETGLIIPLGNAVMHTALARMRQLLDMGLDPGHVAVNVTGPQLLDPGFMEQTLSTLAKYRLDPTILVLELTETILLGRAAERIEAVLRAFSLLGMTLALDDFGTGYASLAHLSMLPIGQLKVDRSFVAGIGKGGASEVITRTVISLARNLGMVSVAEGIETTAQLAFLEQAHCDVGQGYLFAMPLNTLHDAAAYLWAATAEQAPEETRHAVWRGV